MNLSPGQLIAIRDQLVKSLARVHDLEKQVRGIPRLNQIINDLTNRLAEKTRLTQELQSHLDQYTPQTATTAVNMIMMDSPYPLVHPAGDPTSPSSFHMAVSDRSIYTGLSAPKLMTSDKIQSCQTHEIGIQTIEANQSNQSTQTCSKTNESEFLSELEQFTVDNRLRQDPIFDHKRFQDLVNCCRAKQWHALLLMSNVLSPSRLPLPAPPSDVDLYRMNNTALHKDYETCDMVRPEYDWDYFHHADHTVNHCKPVLMTEESINTCHTIIQSYRNLRLFQTNLTPSMFQFEAVCYIPDGSQTGELWNLAEWSNTSTELTVHITYLPICHFYLPFTHSIKIIVYIPAVVQKKTSIIEQRQSVASNSLKSLKQSLVLEMQRCLAERRSRGIKSSSPNHWLLNRVSSFDKTNIPAETKMIPKTTMHSEVLDSLTADWLDSASQNPSDPVIQISAIKSSVSPNRSISIKCTTFSQCPIYRRLIRTAEIKPLDKINPVRLTTSVVGRTRTVYPPVVPRRLLWYLSIPSKQKQLTDSMEELVTDCVKNKSGLTPTRSRSSIFKSIKLKRTAKERHPPHEMPNSKSISDDSKIDRQQTDETDQSITKVPICSPELNALQVAVSLPDVNACQPFISSSPLPIVQMKMSPITEMKRPLVDCESISSGANAHSSSSTFCSSVAAHDSTTTNPSVSQSYSKLKCKIAGCGKITSSPTRTIVGLSDKNKLSTRNELSLITKSKYESKSPYDGCELSDTGSNSVNQSLNLTERLEAKSEKRSTKSQTRTSNGISTGKPDTTTGLVSVQFLAACQTFAAWLEDSTNISCKAMNDATETVKRSWFEVTSGPEADEKRVWAHIKALKYVQSCPIDRVVNMTDKNGNTALHYAVSHAHWTVVGVLLTNCPTVDVNIFNQAGYTPSMLAAVVANQPQNSKEMHALEQLLSKADLSLCSANPQQQTVLMLAAIHGRISLIHRLLTIHNAPINQKDADGSTALMAAAEHNRANVVRLLLSQPDVDADLRDNDGYTALDIALSQRHHEIALMIYAKVKIQKLRRDRLLKHPNTMVNRHIPHGEN